MKIKKFIYDFSEKAEQLIKKYEEYKELTGKQKKARVDEALLKWALIYLDTLAINGFLKWGLKFILNNYLDDFTQLIFNFIETKIEGITK